MKEDEELTPVPSENSIQVEFYEAKHSDALKLRVAFPHES
jgi:hypothetical protein